MYQNWYQKQLASFHSVGQDLALTAKRRGQQVRQSSHGRKGNMSEEFQTTITFMEHSDLSGKLHFISCGNIILWTGPARLGAEGWSGFCWSTTLAPFILNCQGSYSSTHFNTFAVLGFYIKEICPKVAFITLKRLDHAQKQLNLIKYYTMR